MKKHAMLIIILMSICLLGYLLIKPRVLFVESATACVYCYEYYDDEDKICYESVELKKEDLEQVKSMLNGRIFTREIDYDSGFSLGYCLDFKFANGGSKKVLIQHGFIQCLKLDKSDCTLEFSAEQKNNFFEMLKQYHKHDRVILAG